MPQGISGKVAVVGTAVSEITRRARRPVGLLALEAIIGALDKAGLSVSDVDGLASYPELTHFGSPRSEGLDVVSVDFVARHLQLQDTLRWHVQPDSMIQDAFIEAVNAVAAGACDTCVVYRAMHNPSGRYNVFDAATAAGELQFYLPYGLYRGYLSWGAAYGLYMQRYGATRADMATLILNNRA